MFFFEIYLYENFFTVPRRVRYLRVLNSVYNSTNSLVVSWNKPDGGDEIKHYLVTWYQQYTYQVPYRERYWSSYQYRIQTAYRHLGSRRVAHNIEKRNFDFTIVNLPSETIFQVSIGATNSMGSSSSSITIKTGRYFLFISVGVKSLFSSSFFEF